MENSKKLPISFFEKPRPSAPKNSIKEIIPIKWSKEVIAGKKKVIVHLPREGRKK